jgi:phosphate transport system permease protein
MLLLSLTAALLVMTITGYYLGRRQAKLTAGDAWQEMHSLPSFHGLYVALLTSLPALLVLALWLWLEQPVIDSLVLNSLPDSYTEVSDQEQALLLTDIKSLAGNNIASQQADSELKDAVDYFRRLHTISDYLMAGVIATLILGGLALSRSQIHKDMRARNRVEKIVMGLLMFCSTIAILTTLGIILSLVFEAVRFFQRVPFNEFFFSLEWNPGTAIRTTQVGSSGNFGVIPLLTGTLLITAIAMAVAIPLGLLSAIYMSEFAPSRIRAVVKPIIELLAGIPTVVYGFFAALTVAPALVEAGSFIGLNVSSQSALAAGVVMGIMIIPFVSSLSDDVISSVPQRLRYGAMALGATDAEIVRKVVLPAALPGIVGAIIMAVSTAIGETMIVLMAAGLYANLTANPLEAVTTITVQIANLLTGDQQFDSAKTLSAFALGLFLFTITLLLNVIALKVTQHYREKYD